MTEVLKFNPNFNQGIVYAAVRKEMQGLIGPTVIAEKREALVWNKSLAQRLERSLIKRVCNAFPEAEDSPFPNLNDNAPRQQLVIESTGHVTHTPPVYEINGVSLKGFLERLHIENRMQDGVNGSVSSEMTPDLRWVSIADVPSPSIPTNLAPLRTALSFILQYPTVLDQTALMGYTLDQKNPHDLKIFFESKPLPWILYKNNHELFLGRDTSRVCVKNFASLKIIHQEGGI